MINMLNDGPPSNPGSHSYVYDSENRIRQVDNGGATYTYDAEGNRIRKDVTGKPSTEYVYSGGNVIAERDVTSGTWSDYIYAGGKRIAKSDNFEDRIHTHRDELLELRLPVVSVCLHKPRTPHRARAPHR